MAFPLAKIGFLLVKQVTKPMSKRLRGFALESPVFRRGVVALSTPMVKIQARLTAAGNGGAPGGKLPYYNELKLVEMGADAMAEGLVLAVAMGIVVVDYRSRAVKSAADKARLHDDRERINERF